MMLLCFSQAITLTQRQQPPHCPERMSPSKSLAPLHACLLLTLALQSPQGTLSKALPGWQHCDCSRGSTPTLAETAGGCESSVACHAGNPVYETAAVKAVSRLWSMRSPLNLVASSLNMHAGYWNDRVGGTGAGADSFYEYLLKAYVLFGKSDPRSVIFTVLALQPASHMHACQHMPRPHTPSSCSWTACKQMC